MDALAVLADVLALPRLHPHQPQQQQQPPPQPPPPPGDAGYGGGGGRRYGAGAVAPPPGAAAVLKLAADLLDRDQPGLIEGALETLDRAPVRRIVTRQHRRELHVVKGRDRLDYTVLGQRDCSCQAFAHEQFRSLAPKCKHLLAVRLAPHMGRLEEQEVGEDAFESYCGLGSTV